MLKRGDPIDVWIVDYPLGQGGMGSVYRCHNRNARRILAAVKMLDSSLRRSEQARLRFIREAEILFELDHPGIVKVRNVRMDVPRPYLEMEFVDGVDLEQRLLARPLPLTTAVDLMGQILSALAYLHARGIHHRDIKPSNIVLQADGRAKIVDFGIAVEADGLRLTAGEQGFGSIAYVPPEWSLPGADPALWDIYSAGLVFAELLTGQPVFSLRPGAPMQEEVVRLLRAKQTTPGVALPEEIPAKVRELVDRMTRSEPSERLADLARARELLAEVGPIADAPRTRATRARSESRAHRVTTPLRLTTPLEALREVGPTLVPVEVVDPSHSFRRLKRDVWLEVRWASAERFQFWCSTQLINYTLVLPVSGEAPTEGKVRALLVHDDVHIDCRAELQAAAPGALTYRLALDAMQIDRLHRWLARPVAAKG